MGVIMIEQENRLHIAVLQEQISGLREQQRAHQQLIQSRFDQLDAKVNDLVAIMNRGKGAYAASMALVTGIGAVLIEIINLTFSYFHK